MEALILAIPAWLTDAVLELSIYVLCVAVVAVLMRVWAEWGTPHIEDDLIVGDFPAVPAGLTHAQFEQLYGGRQ